MTENERKLLGIIHDLTDAIEDMGFAAEIAKDEIDDCIKKSETMLRVFRLEDYCESEYCNDNGEIKIKMWLERVSKIKAEILLKNIPKSS